MEKEKEKIKIKYLEDDEIEYKEYQKYNKHNTDNKYDFDLSKDLEELRKFTKKHKKIVKEYSKIVKKIGKYQVKFFKSNLSEKNIFAIQQTFQSIFGKLFGGIVFGFSVLTLYGILSLISLVLFGFGLANLLDDFAGGIFLGIFLMILSILLAIVPLFYILIWSSKMISNRNNAKQEDVNNNQHHSKDQSTIDDEEEQDLSEVLTVYRSELTSSINELLDKVLLSLDKALKYATNPANRTHYDIQQIKRTDLIDFLELYINGNLDEKEITFYLNKIINLCDNFIKNQRLANQQNLKGSEYYLKDKYSK